MQWEAPAAFVDWLHRSTAGLPGRLQQAIALLRERGLLRRLSAREWALDPKYPSTQLAQKLRAASLVPDRHLPPMLTDFIGREAEQRAINSLLDRSRLVSLVGPGGIGKTRLALQNARTRSPDFGDGVRFVPLTSTFDPELVTSAIASALGVRETVGKSLRDSLFQGVADKDMLLVLDNFEQVVAAAPLVSELLAAAKFIRVLVTSREPLRIASETTFSVPPLPLPGPAHRASDEDATKFAAVGLFVLRAQAVSYGFALTNENASAVNELCARLDGLPLAIEIAAARMDCMTPQQMLEEHGRVMLSAEGAQDLPARQQTLRSVIDWSFALLDEPRQRLFARLSVFAGGAFLEAIADICDTGDLGSNLAEIVQSLVDKSLLHVDASEDTPRYLMLETIRTYALERLDALADRAPCRDRHAAYFKRRAEELALALNGTRERLTLELFEHEHPNFRAALSHTREGHPDVTLQIALALAPFWERRGHWTEGRRALDDLANVASIDEKYRARCLSWCGRLARLQSDKDTAIALLNRARELAEREGDDRALAMSLNDLGYAAMRLDGDYARARDLLLQSLMLYRTARLDPGVAEVLANLGMLAYEQGNYSLADQYCNEGLALARELGDAHLAGTVMNVLGLVARARGISPRRPPSLKRTSSPASGSTTSTGPWTPSKAWRSSPARTATSRRPRGCTNVTSPCAATSGTWPAWPGRSRTSGRSRGTRGSSTKPTSSTTRAFASTNAAVKSATSCGCSGTKPRWPCTAATRSAPPTSSARASASTARTPTLS